MSHAARTPIALVALTMGALLPGALAAAGCARGSGADTHPLHDAGHVGLDSGTVTGGDSGTITGTDSGTTTGADSGTTPTGCTSAADCSDGLACNGAERCELGTCVAGAPPACDDGVACTTDSCVEPGTCAYAPSDALCPSGQRCTATGCSSTTTMCAESPCRLVSPQCGCATGQACYLSGSSRVCATAGTATEGMACTGAASCAAGLDCIDFSGAAGGTGSQCARYCGSDSDCVGAGSLCIHGLSDGAGGTIAGVEVCSRACDPIGQTGCASGLMCNVYQEMAGAGRFLTDCVGPIGTGTSGVACAADSDCAAGYACIMTSTGAECLRWCNAGTGGVCPSGTTCTSLGATVGSTDYGVCL